MVLEGKKILVCGAKGKSGTAAVRLYLSLGATVFLSDSRTEDISTELPDGRLHDVSPRQDEALLDEFEFDWIVTAPGVPLLSPFFIHARQKDVPVYGENDFAYRLIRQRGIDPFFIGITGTDGKSTTTALLAHLINSAMEMRAIPCGNFGSPLSDFVLDASPDDVYVVELSSYQLEPLVWFHPQIGMILNLSDDHLDRYSGREEYLRAKLRILELQTPEDLFLSTGPLLERGRDYLREIGNAWMPRMVDPLSARPQTDERIDIPSLLEKFSLRGRHNRNNLLFSLVAFDDLLRRKGVPADQLRLERAVATFRGLPHRFELVRDEKGFRFINDSKATTVQAVLGALSSLEGERVFLLCGGKNKGLDFSPLKRSGPGVALYCFGEAAEEIAKATASDRIFRSLDLAVEAAFADMQREGGGVMLLSPGCASFDAFSSYAHRGDSFRNLVEQCRI